VFEALSSEERISILKLLDQNRQMTGTDVANSLTISKSSAFKQLNRLARAGLVERMDEGRKWIYYRNTSKAERLLHPEDVTITLVLSAAVAALVVAMIVLLSVQPVLSPGGTGGLPSAQQDPSVLVLGHPTLDGTNLVITIFAGSADLSDLAIFVAEKDSGAVVVAATPTTAPVFASHGSISPSSASQSVRVADTNGNGALDAGDSITVTGMPADGSMTLWVASVAGSALAHTDLVM
jgi:DNA-binding transcriptional ArsR family regulator